MKKCFALLTLVLLLFACAQAEEPLNVSVYAYELENLAGGRVRLSLLLYKEGDPGYCLQDVETVLYDAQGGVLTPEKTEIVLLPLTDIPAGGHMVPVTIEYTFGSPVQAADFDVTRLVGWRTDEAGTEELDSGVPYLAAIVDGDHVCTAWIPVQEGADPQAYFITAAAVDAQRNYVGNGAFLPGTGVYVPGNRMERAICDDFGLADGTLTDMGFVFEHPAYVLFASAQMPYVSVIPDSFILTAYTVKPAEPEMPVVRLSDEIYMQTDGSFTVTGLLRSDSSSLWELAEFAYVVLVDESGREIVCEELEYDVPYRVLNSGEYLPYVITGQTEAGFRPVSFSVAYVLSRADASDHRPAGEGSLDLVANAGGETVIRCSMELPEGAAAEDCFAFVMFFDVAADEYIGGVWTYPGEGWLQDGIVCLPDMEPPVEISDALAMIPLFCVAE